MSGTSWRPSRGGKRRRDGNAVLFVIRVEGTARRHRKNPWQWIASVSNPLSHIISLFGACATEEEARAAAEEARPRVVRASEALRPMTETP